ncbi:DNA-3-methyladenine glycosylase [Castellaniella defragrans]|jgi:DNA-3-methyladenine glycosylase|nr:DNA-3-methyladenine glycosylase [Castellaniella defragrans]KAB0612957.1 DNA-3-methyladenine glycosylase [Castellaniella defragrans]MBB6083074.1 DNA-3-methyladenine glycosylase [Castellaniella defragrans]
MAATAPLSRLVTPADPLQGDCRRLDRAFYDRPVETVARDLLGRLLVHATPAGPRIGRIVEVEAYLGPGDLAAHTARGRTARTRAMFGPPGHAYVYLIYGMHHCMNVVTGPEGSGTAVLLRALAPVLGLDASTSGPGRLCRAMGVTRDHYGIDLCGDTLWLARDDAPPPAEIAAGPRIGVDYAGEWAAKPLRFFVPGHPAVSRAPKKTGPTAA